MKKMISLFLALALLLCVLVVPAMADDFLCGTLSYLNMTEEEDESLGTTLRMPLMRLLFLHGVLDREGADLSVSSPSFRYYDTLEGMLMALQSGELNSINVPYYTARYLCSINDNLKLRAEYHPEKANEFCAWVLSILSDGYSFMMKEDNAELRDAFNAQLTAMKEDGTLQKLIDEYIVKASEGGEPAAVAFEKFEGDPIKVAVTGALPPMDYVAPDGSFAGFNTAVLAEIGKRLQKNVQLVQVDSIGRALALSEGIVDVVFWTRAMSDSLAERRPADDNSGEEKLNPQNIQRLEAMTEEEKAILADTGIPDSETRAKFVVRDMPDGTIITQPYFTDFQVQVILK